MVRTRTQQTAASNQASLPYEVLVLLELNEGAAFACSLVSKNCRDAMQFRWPLRPIVLREAGEIPNVKLIRFEAKSVAATRSIARMSWALDTGCPPSMVSDAVARKGSLDVLKAARERGCPWGPRTLSNAVQSALQAPDKVGYLVERMTDDDFYELIPLDELDRLRTLQVARQGSWRQFRQLATQVLQVILGDEDSGPDEYYGEGCGDPNCPNCSSGYW